MSESGEDTYALRTRPGADVPAPLLAYQPPKACSYHPRIALVGTGGIAQSHLDAYRQDGLDVRVVCNRTVARAVARRDAFFPEAEATDDIDATLTRTDIDVVDITTHPAERIGLIERALSAGKHVLSQKPFVLDLGTGERLADLADRNGVRLAVNQNGRWAPHFAYMREAVRSGLLGNVISCHTAVHWNHGWIKGTPFEEVDELVLYDFAIHWFDFLTSIIGTGAKSVFATSARATGQDVKPPLLSQALVAFEGGQASLIFDAAVRFGSQDCTYISGTHASIASTGPNLGEQKVTLYTEAGVASPVLSGTWFNDGFRGTMSELICAIEENREPLNGARGNLVSLALCFAAIASAHRGGPIAPGTVRSLAAATTPQ